MYTDACFSDVSVQKACPAALQRLRRLFMAEKISDRMGKEQE